MDANLLYRYMWDEASAGTARQSSDPTSPTQGDTRERTNLLVHFGAGIPSWVGGMPGKRWAVANILHFFAATEDAQHLAQYNPAAYRFAPDGVLRGAYGPIAMPQLLGCIEELRGNAQSRRAFVSMGPFVAAPTINSPACWNTLHFLLVRQQLNLTVYQRSLNVAVMPYDLTLLMHILKLVASASTLAPGVLHWYIGSAHVNVGSRPREHAYAEALDLPLTLLASPELCIQCLAGNHELLGEYASWVSSQQSKPTTAPG